MYGFKNVKLNVLIGWWTKYQTFLFPMRNLSQWPIQPELISEPCIASQTISLCICKYSVHNMRMNIPPSLLLSFIFIRLTPHWLNYLNQVPRQISIGWTNQYWLDKSVLVGQIGLKQKMKTVSQRPADQRQIR